MAAHGLASGHENLQSCSEQDSGPKGPDLQLTSDPQGLGLGTDAKDPERESALG